MFKLHKAGLNQEYCVSQGGHLASVGSEREFEQMKKVAGDYNVWLGGKRTAEGESWQWLDGRDWGYIGGKDDTTMPLLGQTI